MNKPKRPEKDGWNECFYPECYCNGWNNELYEIYKRKDGDYMCCYVFNLEQQLEKLSLDGTDPVATELVRLPSFSAAQAAARVHFDKKELTLKNIMAEMS